MKRNGDLEYAGDGRRAWACYSYGKYAVCLWPPFEEREYKWLVFIKWSHEQEVEDGVRDTVPSSALPDLRPD